MAVCRTKQQYDTWYEAFEASEYINQRTGYSMLEYRCCYCDRWHLRTVNKRYDYRRIERRRRQWLRDQRTGNDEVWTSI